MTPAAPQTAKRAVPLPRPSRLSDAGVSPDQAGTGVGQKSSGKFSARREVMTYRQHFAVVWQRFVTENFDSPAHAAHVFQVDSTTAVNWFQGVNAPSGWVVGRAIADPDMRDAALGFLTARP